MPSTAVLVVGATGDTGKHVVQMLLDKGKNVRVIARSKEKMLSVLKDDADDYGDRLVVTEASLLDLTDEQLKEEVKNCQAVVSCLGHNPTMKGLWGAPYYLCRDAAQRLSKAMPSTTCKFILMNSDGVSNPDGKTDSIRPLLERSVLAALRYLVPPVADNEAAALYLHEHHELAWSVVRPTTLTNADTVTEYEASEQQQGSLFGSETVTRVNVAAFIVQLVLEEGVWGTYKHKMPVVYDKKAEPALETKK